MDPQDEVKALDTLYWVLALLGAAPDRKDHSWAQRSFVCWGLHHICGYTWADVGRILWMSASYVRKLGGEWQEFTQGRGRLSEPTKSQKSRSEPIPWTDPPVEVPPGAAVLRDFLREEPDALVPLLEAEAPFRDWLQKQIRRADYHRLGRPEPE